MSIDPDYAVKISKNDTQRIIDHSITLLQAKHLHTDIQLKQIRFSKN